MFRTAQCSSLPLIVVLPSNEHKAGEDIPSTRYLSQLYVYNQTLIGGGDNQYTFQHVHELLEAPHWRHSSCR